MDNNDAKRQQLTQLLQADNGIAGLSRATVAQAMTPQPTCISPYTNALELIELFHAKGFRHLLVADSSGKLVGVISDRDVIGCLGPNGSTTKEALTGIKAEDLMSSDLIWVGPAVSLTDAIRLMVENGISCLPIIRDGQAIGILTSTDLYLLLEQLLNSLSAVCPSESSSTASPMPHN